MMENDQKGEVGTSMSVNVGKGVDAALGDVVRGLLKKPAEEAGNLLADGIGILGDRVRRKRLHNTQRGLEETRTMLEAKDVELKNITPPFEEELHVVLEGMSLSGDDHVRKLWSGLLASALTPESYQRIDRPITSAIAALTPADAKVIEFAAFVTKENRAIQRDAELSAGVEGKSLKTFGDWDRVEKARAAMGERLVAFIERVIQMEKDFDLQTVTASPDWSDNLERLGVIKAKPESYNTATSPPSIHTDADGRDVKVILDYVERRIEEAEGLALEGIEIGFLYRVDQQKKRVELGVGFTRFGEKLCKACGLF